MNILGRKLRRDLGQTWKMLLAVASITAIGIGCYIGMLSAARNLTAAKGQYYSVCRLADFWIDLKKAPEQEVQRLSQVPGISEIRTRIQTKVLCDLEGVDEPVGGMMISMPPDPTPVINGLVMRSGSYFTQGRMNEVILSEKFATARNVRAGDPLAVIMNGQQRDLIVVGTAISAEFVYLTSPGSMVDDPKNYGLFYVKQAFAEESFGFEGACNSVVGMLTPEAQENPEPVIQQLADQLEPYGVFSSIPRSVQFSHMTLSAELTQLESMAIMFPLFFMVVASLVLNVLMTRLIEQQRTIIGTLKALGYFNRDLFVHYLEFGMAAGLAGGLIGSGIGFWMSSAMTTMYLVFFSFPNLVSGLYPALMLNGILVSIAFCMLGTLNGVRRGMKLKPAEAMRPPAPRGGRMILLERWTALWRRLDIQWQMVLRDLMRRKGRTAISIFSAAMGASIVVLALGFVDSVDELIAQQFRRVLRSDFHLTFSGDVDVSVLDEIRRLPGVNHVEPVFQVACTFENQNHRKKGGIMGIPIPSRLTVPSNAQGHPVPVPASGLLMAERLAEQLDVDVGDTVRLIPVRGDQLPVPAVVAGTFPSTMGLAVYAEIQWLNRLMRERASASEARVLAQQQRHQRNAFMRAIKQMPQLETVTDIREQKKALVKQMDGAMRAMAVIMIFFAAVIFFGAILNSTLIAMAERQREIATFSAMGYTHREIGRLFLRENMLTNLVGTLVGLPLGRAMLFGMMAEFQTDAYSFSAALQPVSLFYTVVLAICFVWATQVVVAAGLRKLNPVEALAMKE